MPPEFTVQTHASRDFVDVAARVNVLFGAPSTINENADPDVVADLLAAYADVLVAEHRWQAVYLCEFDGPRRRTVQVQVIGQAAAGPRSAPGRAESG